MKTLLLLIVFGVAPIAGKVTHVSDGDTFRMASGSINYTVRAAHIDAPELDQPYGDSAMTYAKQLLLGKVVIVRNWKKDKYGRLAGAVQLPDGQLYHFLMLIKGYAWWYRAYSSDNLSEATESVAQERKSGLWKDSCAVAPWVWRKRGESSSPARPVGGNGSLP